MTAHPSPEQAPPVRRPANVAEAIRNLETHTASGQRRGERMVRLDLQRVRLVLAYEGGLEHALAEAREEKRTFEAEAEAELAERRLELRAWQRYAFQLENQRDALRTVIAALLAALQRLVDARWWQRRARRVARWAVEDWRMRSAQVLATDDPTSPPLPVHE